MHENWDTWRTKRGVIVAGQLTPEQAMGINSWANTMGWILLTDIQSGVEPLMPYADIWLANQTVKQKLLQAIRNSRPGHKADGVAEMPMKRYKSAARCACPTRREPRANMRNL